MIAFMSPSVAMMLFDQLRTFQNEAERDVPHHEQTVSSLPISCLQRGQRVARAIDLLAPVESVFILLRYWLLQRIH